MSSSRIRSRTYRGVLWAALLVAQLGAIASSAAATCQTLRGRIEELVETIEIPLEDGHLFPPDIRPRFFEVMLAADSLVPILEVVAVVRNFSEVFIKDGSINVFRINNRIVLDAETNLIGAYKYGMTHLEPGRITTENIETIRRLAMQRFVKGKGRRTEEPELRYKDARDAALVKGTIHPEVLSKLTNLGYKISKEDDLTRIQYVDTPPGQHPLTDYVTTLNHLTQPDRDPERAVAYAVQELLLIHPFADGNGRTARLVGQILYKKLTGKTVLFPPEFHRELDYSLAHLTALLKGKPSEFPIP